MPVAPCSCLSALIDLERFPFFLFKRKRKWRREEFIAFLDAPEKERGRKRSGDGFSLWGVLWGDQHIWGPRLENKAAKGKKPFRPPDTFGFSPPLVKNIRENANSILNRRFNYAMRYRTCTVNMRPRSDPPTENTSVSLTWNNMENL